MSEASHYSNTIMFDRHSYKLRYAILNLCGNKLWQPKYGVRKSFFFIYIKYDAVVGTELKNFRFFFIIILFVQNIEFNEIVSVLVLTSRL